MMVVLLLLLSAGIGGYFVYKNVQKSNRINKIKNEAKNINVSKIEGIDPIFKKKPDWTNININTPEGLAKLDNNIGIISQKTDALNALVKKNN